MCFPPVFVPPVQFVPALAPVFTFLIVAETLLQVMRDKKLFCAFWPPAHSEALPVLPVEAELNQVQQFI
jgi:hypothetical protein